MKYYYQIEGLKRNNLGDVIQGLAAKQFLPNDAIAVDRENLKAIENEQGLLIANGWYQHEFENFPPPPLVTPFYISVHIAKSDFLKLKNVREHFKKNAPIGCRDLKTLWLMRGFGIPAYYSSCLTLTLNNNIISNNNNNEIIWVDNIDHPIPLEVEEKLNELIPNGFIKISHDPLSILFDFNSYVIDNIKSAENLFAKYQNAKLVLTTKIHCALPCIGMGVPVILIHPNPSDPRLSVLNKLISIVSYDELLILNYLPKPHVNKIKAKNLKNRLIKLVSLAVKTNKNPFSDTQNFILSIQFSFYKTLAFLTSNGLKLVYKIGFNKKTFERIFGKEFLVG